MPFFIPGKSSTHLYVIKQNLKINLEKKIPPKPTLPN